MSATTASNADRDWYLAVKKDGSFVGVKTSGWHRSQTPRLYMYESVARKMAGEGGLVMSIDLATWGNIVWP